MMTIQDIAIACAEAYAQDENPLAKIREMGYQTHFELINGNNEWFMHYNRSQKNEFFNNLVVLLKKTDKIVHVRVFYQGEDAEAEAEMIES